MLLFTEVTIWSLGDKRVHWPVPKLYNWLCPSFINTLALGRAHSWSRPSQENHYFDQTVKLNIFSFKTYNLVSAGRCSSLREFLSQNICCSPHPKGLAFASAWEVRSRASHPKPSWLLNSDASIAPLFSIFTILISCIPLETLWDKFIWVSLKALFCLSAHKQHPQDLPLPQI